MLVLFETPAGYALFKVQSDIKGADADDVWKQFTTPEKAAQAVKLKAFSKFDDTTAALSAATAICDGKLDKGLRHFLSEAIGSKTEKVTLGVSDSKLGGLIKDKLSIKCVFDNSVQEVVRGIRQHMNSLIAGLAPTDTAAFQLGLSHSLARYKLKFSPDKVDTMIIQAIALLDELDKELNTYAMRVREWYGWHFPEMGKIIADNIQYAKVVKKMGVRTAAHSTDFSDILEEEVEVHLKEAAEVSMGTEIAEEDVENISSLCDQVINIAQYRASLYEYLKHRMNAIAPNLTVMVGELVGARLIAHAGSLLSLAKQPASTVQILGAEKALFRALKTKSNQTPKFGLIYHASLVGQAAPKLKGKVSRMLAAKTALCIRMDALGEVDGVSIGLEGREKIEMRLKQMETGQSVKASGSAKKPEQSKYQRPTQNIKQYNADSDVNMTNDTNGVKKEKKENGTAQQHETQSNGVQAEEEVKPKKEKKKKDKEKRKIEEVVEENNDVEDKSERKKKKKDKKSSD